MCNDNNNNDLKVMTITNNILKNRWSKSSGSTIKLFAGRSNNFPCFLFMVQLNTEKTRRQKLYEHNDHISIIFITIGYHFPNSLLWHVITSILMSLFFVQYKDVFSSYSSFIFFLNLLNLLSTHILPKLATASAMAIPAVRSSANSFGKSSCSVNEVVRW